MNQLPFHFALSEALIVGAATYAVVQTWRVDRWFAVGMSAIAVAAFVAVIHPARISFAIWHDIWPWLHIWGAAEVESMATPGARCSRGGA